MKSESARTRASPVIKRPKVPDRIVRLSSHDWSDVRQKSRNKPGCEER